MSGSATSDTTAQDGTGRAALVTALQTTLEGEHAALYVLGVLGARTSASASPELYARLQGLYAAHRARRDDLSGTLLSLGEDPVGAAVAYDVPGPAAGVAAQGAGPVVDTARGVEARCARAYAVLVGSSTGARRRWAVDALRVTAVGLLDLGGSPEALPGTA
ncbi:MULTISPECIES: DUF4439 domain-containing protein [unclassified Nocardioides]|uniref:DUF4439 domain-containing protein n=1 Tax=unclassified Nocardioides TaxID=2615069 RepID=UPI0007038B8A|nr:MULTISPECIES: DUF4439 domain-containing protein [unclassified Nocardioides]KQQ41634.1 hypothetical protein ASF50_11770 [Nocardioides sp. Leaf307]